MSGSYQPEMGPQAILSLHFAMMPSRALAAAVQCDLFSALASAPAGVAALAHATGCDRRGLRMLLDAMAALGFLTKQEGVYDLAPQARRYLVRGAPDYVGAILETDDIWDAWTGLPQTVRSGRPTQTVDRVERAERFFPTLIRSLHVMNRAPAERLAAALSLPDDARVLDVAAGSAVWSIACAERHRSLRVIAHDFPRVLTETRGFVGRHGLSGRYDYLAGDLKSVDFGQGAFDLALLGNIVHSEGAESSRALFVRLHAALRRGGQIAIIDFLPEPDRTGPPQAVLFALNMLVATVAGDTFTLAEYTGWLEAAGFAEVRTVDIGAHLGVAASAVVARRA